jgi:hypothetical protein
VWGAVRNEGWRSGDVRLLPCSAVRRVRGDGEEAIVGLFGAQSRGSFSVTICFATGFNFFGEH